MRSVFYKYVPALLDKGTISKFSKCHSITYHSYRSSINYYYIKIRGAAIQTILPLVDPATILQD